MSLINDMLQDLETRRGSIHDAAGVPRHVRVLPLRNRRHHVRILSATLGVSCAAAMVWFVYQSPPIGHFRPARELAIAATPGASAAETASDSIGTTLRVDQLPQPIPTKSVIGESVSARATTVEAARSIDENERHSRSESASVSSRNALRGMSLSLRMDSVPSETISRGNSVAAARNVAPEPTSTQIDRKLREPTPSQLAEDEYRTGVSLLNQGRTAEAQERFNSALRSAPGHVGSRQALFGLLLQAKRYPEAEQTLQDALKIDPAQPGFAMALARLQIDRGEAATAIETLQKAVTQSQTNPEYLAFLGALLQRDGRHAQAVEYYQSALALAPRTGLWLMGLGLSLQALNRTEEARETLRRARSAEGLSSELQAFIDQRLKQIPQS